MQDLLVKETLERHRSLHPNQYCGNHNREQVLSYLDNQIFISSSCHSKVCFYNFTSFLLLSGVIAPPAFGQNAPPAFGQNLVPQASTPKSCTGGTIRSVSADPPKVKVPSNTVNTSTPSTAITAVTNNSQRAPLSNNKQYRIDPEDTRYNDYVIHWVQLLASQHSVHLLL